MPRTELELLRDGAVVRVIPVGDEPVRLGRDLANTIVLLDEDVSAHHAVVAVAAEGVVVRDLRSTNGTFVNGERVSDSRTLHNGDELTLGEAVRLRLRHDVLGSGNTTPVLQDLTAGIVYALENDRILIGSGEGCQIRLVEGPERAVTLVVHPNDEVWLGTSEGDRPISVDETFEVGGHTFRLSLAPHSAAATFRGRVPARYPYSLDVTLEGAGGAVATLRHTGGLTHTVTSENRATLLYVLARQLLDDRAAHRLEDEAGWCDDEDVLLAVWGRAAMRQASSNYSVLLHRLRKELEEAGFDPWFIEKRRGAIRLRLQDVQVH